MASSNPSPRCHCGASRRKHQRDYYLHTWGASTVKGSECESFLDARASCQVACLRRKCPRVISVMAGRTA